MKYLHPFVFIMLLGHYFFTNAQSTQKWFFDDFNDNQNGWEVSKNDAIEYKIENGHYVLNNKNTQHNIYWMFKNIYMNPTKDFTVETRFKLSNTLNDGNAGFFLTDRNGKMNFFCINSSSQAFWVGYTNNGKWGSYTATETGNTNSGWQKTNALKEKGEYNTLKIERKGTSLSFFLNNNKVLTLPSSDFCNDLRKHIGFVIETAAEMQIDYIMFDQDNWKDVIEPNAKPIVAQNMGPEINTYADEVNSVVTADMKTIFFTRLHSQDNYEGVDLKNNENDGDIYYSKYIDGKWTKAKRLEFGISNKNNNSLASVSPDGNSVLLFGNYDQKSNSSNVQGGLAISYRTKDGWSYPENLNIKNYYSNTPIINFFMNDDGQTLILCIERKDSKGQADFYVSFKEKDNSWTEPKKMEGKMNTALTDFSPFIAADGKTMYFASWELPGYGEADMFITKRLDDSWTKWSDPVNMGPAINNDGFNAYYKISTDAKLVYFSSTKNSLGYSDLFMSPLPEALKPDPVNQIKGKVLDAKTQKPLGATIRYENIATAQKTGETRSNPQNGEFTILLPYGKVYGFHAAADGYIAVNDHLDLSIAGNYAEMERIIYLVPIEIGQVVSLNNVFFKQGLDQLLPNSYPELDRLVEILKANPGLEIELHGHTDNQGDAKLNIALSEQRATAVQKYLESHGVLAKNISGKGFGGTKPIAPNDKEDNRKKNRRVEFVIIKNKL